MKWNWKEFLQAALIRALRTFAQTFVGFISVGMAWNEVSWLHALSVSGAACAASIITSFATGLPEVQQQPPDEPEEETEE